MCAHHDSRAVTSGRNGVTPDRAALVAALAAAFRDGGELTPGTLEMASSLGADLRGSGRSPGAISIVVRRALADAAPAAMTVSAFEPLARTLVAQALQDDGRLTRTLPQRS